MDEFLAKIILDDEGNFRVQDIETGEIGEPCKFCDADDKTIVLTVNKSNRKWFNRKRAMAEIEANGFCGLTYKASRHVGTGVSTKIPNKKLIEYLSEEEKAEYMAIIDRAREAMMADRKKPMTEREKLEAKIAKAKEALAKLEANQAGDSPAESTKKSKKNKKEAE